MGLSEGGVGLSEDLKNSFDLVPVGVKTKNGCGLDGKERICIE